MVADRETYILISDEGLFPAEYIYPADDLFPFDPGMRQVSNIVAGSLKLDEMISEKVPQFGQMFATKFECTVYLEEDLSGKFIHVYQIVDGVSTDVFAGKIDSCKLDNVGTDRKLIAYDLAYEKGKQNVAEWWERFWYGRETATLRQVRESLLSSMTISFENVELPNDNMVVTKTVSLTSCTMTAMLKMICELNYCFPHLNREGLMEFILLNTEPEETKDLTGKYEGLNSTFEDFVTYDITGVQFFDSGSELKYTYGEIENAYPVKENIFLYDRPTSVLQSIAAEMMSYLSDFSYTPGTVKMIIGDMSLQLGDHIHTEKGDFYVMQNSYSGSQFFEQTIKAQGQELLYSGTQNFDYNEVILSEKIARVRQTVEAFEVEYADFKEDTQANFRVTADSISSEVSRAQRAENSLSSQIQQTAESINLSVENGSTESTIKIRIGQTEISSGTIYMQGLVKFVDILNEDSGTIINGSLITTGTIDATRVNVTNLNADNIKSGSITISDAGSHVRALQIIKNNEVLAYMDADNGIVVGKDQEGYNRTSISERGFFTGANNKRVDISSGNVECTHTVKCQTANCTYLTVNGLNYSRKTVSMLDFSGTKEIKTVKLNSTTLWAVNSTSAPSMKGNTSDGYRFSSNPSWTKISLSETSFTTKVYGVTGTVSSYNRSILGSWV